jgi:hypothetical protein
MATTHGASIAAEMGLDPSSFKADPSAIKAGFGITDGTGDTLTYSDLQARRELIRKRLGQRS